MQPGTAVTRRWHVGGRAATLVSAALLFVAVAGCSPSERLIGPSVTVLNDLGRAIVVRHDKA